MSQANYEIAIGIVIATIIFLLAGFFILILVAYYHRRKRAFQQDLLMTRLETQEETFAHIGRELHDNVGQLLSSTKLLLGITERSLSTVPDSLKTAEETLGRAIHDLRALSKSLDKDWLNQFNVIDNLKAEAERINAARSMTIAIDSPHPTVTLAPDMQIVLFRIVQEAIQNSLKHAQAQAIGIRVDESAQEIRVTVADDGKGLDESAVRGQGMTNMQKRTNLLHGTIDWRSQPGQGTTVTLSIPPKPSI
jgi:signal transduction histidine kinase